jgi:glycosyltransferase involved in cell wall biosynthesis
VRVLCLDQFSESGGAQLCLRDVLLEVRQRGWDAVVMAPGDGPLLQFSRTLGCETATLPLSKYANGRKSGRDLLSFPTEMVQCARQVLRKGPFDLFYVNGPRVLPAVARTPVPVLFHSHNLLNKQYARAVVRWSLGPRAAVVSCSEFIARSLRSHLARPVKVIYNGVADCGFHSRPVIGHPLRVGILGRISPEKGHLDFIKAAHRLADRGQTRFIVIGAALFSDPKYERSVQERGAREGVEFRGWTDQPAKALHELDVLAVPSASAEASPRVIMEALSAGTIVVAYPSGGIPELIRNGYDGLLAESCTSEALAESIQTLAMDPGLRHLLAENGRKTWETRFTVERFRREVCDELTAQAASGGRSGSPEEPRAHDEKSVLP